MIKYRAHLLLVTCLAMAGCMSSQPPRQNTANRFGKPRFESARQLVTESEIAGARALMAYDLLARIRPEFLKPPLSPDSHHPAPEPIVYIDGLPAGGLSVLSEIPIGIIAEIRFVTSRDAALQRGQSHGGGEIMVYTRR